MKEKFPLKRFESLETPFYYYDLKLLKQTLSVIDSETKNHNYHVHYAIKANADKQVLHAIQKAGLGVDCVSGGEIKAALEAGFPASKIVYAGVGKADWEITLALEVGIGSFNVESLAELKIISEIATKLNKTASVALRINPEIDAHTHHYITTGLKENKFGISLEHLEGVIDAMQELSGVKLVGLHFHIGSQITINEPFELLCKRINTITQNLKAKGIELEIINVGGGLGVNYENPDGEPTADFKGYFDVFKENLEVAERTEVHFELGRAIVCQCGSLITRVLYVKEGVDKRFAIVDAGMTELIRPALYQAFHLIEPLTTTTPEQQAATCSYDVVGPICESSDSFGEDVQLGELKRGDMLAIRSVGAYGASMSMSYNCRRAVESHYCCD
ncbi:MAG: diaminopimelate decarboxylase [Rikenellaceae bacterium]